MLTCAPSPLRVEYARESRRGWFGEAIEGAVRWHSALSGSRKRTLRPLTKSATPFLLPHSCIHSKRCILQTQGFVRSLVARRQVNRPSLAPCTCRFLSDEIERTQMECNAEPARGQSVTSRSRGPAAARVGSSSADALSSGHVRWGPPGSSISGNDHYHSRRGQGLMMKPRRRHDQAPSCFCEESVYLALTTVLPLCRE
jgi:hypothetical protein